MTQINSTLITNAENLLKKKIEAEVVTNISIIAVEIQTELANILGELNRIKELQSALNALKTGVEAIKDPLDALGVPVDFIEPWLETIDFGVLKVLEYIALLVELQSRLNTQIGLIQSRVSEISTSVVPEIL